MSFVTHKISDLVDQMSKIQAEHGDLDIVYWDQFSACKMNPHVMVRVCNSDSADEKQQQQQQKKTVYFGGFHVNADWIQEQNTDPNIRENGAYEDDDECWLVGSYFS